MIFTFAPGRVKKQYFTRHFLIIEEFAALEPSRKMILCDHLFLGGNKAFRNTARLLWPHAQKADIKKLENFLTLMKNTGH